MARGERELSYRSIRSWLSPLLIGVALVFGGGSSLFPLNRMMVELVAVPILVMAIMALHRDRLKTALGPLVMIGLLFILFVAQLVPLPPALWMNLPGRGLVADTARELGWASHWAPISLDPEATVRAGLTLVPALAIFLAVLAGDVRDHERLVLTALAGIVFTFGLGVCQSASGWSESLYFYDSDHIGYPTGIFANRNHQAILLAIAPALAAAYLMKIQWQANTPRRTGLPMVPLITIAIVVLCSFGVLATASRTATALLPLTITGTAAMLFRIRMSARARLLAAIAIGVVCLVALAALMRSSGVHVLTFVGDRFVDTKDQRFDFWPDVVYAIRQYLPVGAGIGTFEPVYNAAERLTIVSPHYLNHAHSDYLEIAVETGIAGLALVAAFIVWFFLSAWRVWRTPQVAMSIVFARMATIGVLVLLLHSAVDYPLRTLALQCLFALFCGLLVRAFARDGASDERNWRALYRAGNRRALLRND